MSKSDRIRTLERLLSGYLVAAISVVIAAVITLKLGSVIKHTSTLFFCSVMFSSWYGGLRPEVFAAFLSVVALDYYLIPPLYALCFSLEEAPDMIVFPHQNPPELRHMESDKDPPNHQCVHDDLQRGNRWITSQIDNRHAA